MSSSAKRTLRALPRRRRHWLLDVAARARQIVVVGRGAVRRRRRRSRLRAPLAHRVEQRVMRLEFVQQLEQEHRFELERTQQRNHRVGGRRDALGAPRQQHRLAVVVLVVAGAAAVDGRCGANRRRRLATRSPRAPRAAERVAAPNAPSAAAGACAAGRCANSRAAVAQPRQTAASRPPWRSAAHLIDVAHEHQTKLGQRARLAAKRLAQHQNRVAALERARL
jgi:hypothetical protein